MRIATAGLLLLAASLTLGAESVQPTAAPNLTLTAVRGLSVGHHTLTERPTGCTVVLAPAGAVAGVDVRGAAPGTRETDLLNPVNTVDTVHAIVLAGGSAFGLDAASGVMQYLDERGIGYQVRSHGVPVVVPIVPAAVLIDLGVGGKPTIRPDATCGYQAAIAATDAPVQEGSVGAGAGATVGKLAGYARAMKGGIGSAAVTLPDGLVVAAVIAVNALGDVIDPNTGRVIAGVRTADGRGLADARVLLRERAPAPSPAGENTTIGVVATNRALTKTQATKLAQMAHDGYARALFPVHTPADGDTIFALSTGRDTGALDMTQLGSLAAQVVAEAVVRAATQATGLPGYPAMRDLPR